MLITPRSRRLLQGVHLDLVGVVERAAALAEPGFGFVVIEGLRNVTRQRQLLNAGASRTMRSRHLTGHAVDLAAVVAGEIRWDWPLYHKLASLMKRAASELEVPIEWGGDWETFKDGPHFQLPWKTHPVQHEALPEM